MFSFLKRVPWLYAFWKFSRLHTILGTTLSVLGLCWLAIAETQSDSALGTIVGSSITYYRLPLALLACLCGNVYIVGLNQIEDVAIDRINKPHLPLASGEFSRQTAWTIVSLTGFLALVVAGWQGQFLLATVGLSLLIGTAYSLPPIRLKRFAFWASICIFTVRGVIVNLGLFLHFRQMLSPTETAIVLPASVLTLTLFILVFTFAIAIFKDIPDLEGDRQYNIRTFTLQLGQQTVFNIAMSVLTICYVGMVVAGVGFLPAVNLAWLVGSHLLILAMLWWFSLRVDWHNQGVANGRKLSYTQFYQFIWKLFFLEYILFPIVILAS